MRAGEIMTRSVVTVRTDTSVQHAAALMTGHEITSLPVLDQDGRVVGIVSEADLIRDRMPHDPRSHMRALPRQQPDPAQSVGQVMTDAVVCLGENAEIAELAAVMHSNDVRAVPIVDGGRLLGIVSRRDVLRTLLRGDVAIRSKVTRRVEDYAGQRGRWRIAVDGGVVSIRGRFDEDAQQRW